MASATGIEARPRKIWNVVGEAPLSESTGKTMNTWTLGCFRNDKSFKKKIAIVQTTPPRVKNGKNRPKLLRQQGKEKKVAVKQLFLTKSHFGNTLV